MERFYENTDNRDLYSTVLNMINGDTVEVDPVDLFENALNNCDDEVALDMFDKLMHHLRKENRVFNRRHKIMENVVDVLNNENFNADLIVEYVDAIYDQGEFSKYSKISKEELIKDFEIYLKYR